jgi:NADH-quinone oxidoreductase subunit D
MTEELELRFGPQHPAIDGALLLRLRVDGDRVTDCRPETGRLHRGIEKLFERHPFAGGIGGSGSIGHADPPGLAAVEAAHLAYVGAVEKLLGLAVPPRARQVRTIFAELQRVASHLYWLATHACDVGATAPFPRALQARERILGLLEQACRDCGAGPASGGLFPGGLSHDLPAGWVERCRGLLESLPEELDGLEGLLTDNRIWKKRTVGLGVLSPELAIDCGVTGPALRASGVAWDLRKALPYEAYGEVEFEVPVGRNGDTYDRYRVRMAEMRQALHIAAQCLDRLAEGPVRAGLPPDLVGPRDAEVYHGVEGPRGEIGFYIVGDGTTHPYRCHLRAPSFANLQALPDLCRGELIADLLTLVGTLDLALGEVDR